ncbi:hypothetical protein LZC95_01685 [Pendulispora brunnea]|uniref:MARVEL domain-containing protein n=1 Tax=Pendulispora brunnea TaxID=2905690 RepID=A0ABZ2KA46_9BACT
MAHNPYEVPRSLSAPGGEGDSADLFVQTLPPPLLKLAGLASLLAGLVDLFLVMQFFVAMSAWSARPGPVLSAILGLLFVMGILYLTVAWGIVKGKIPFVIVGLFAAFFSLLASGASLLFVISLAGLGAIGLSMVNVVLLLLNMSNVQRISRAYRALRTQVDPS